MSKVKAPISLRSLQRAAANAVPGKDGASAKVLGATAIFAAGVGVAVHAETTTSLPAVQVDAPKEKPRPAAALFGGHLIVPPSRDPRAARRSTRRRVRELLFRALKRPLEPERLERASLAPLPPTRSRRTPILMRIRRRPIKSTDCHRTNSPSPC